MNAIITETCYQLFEKLIEDACGVSSPHPQATPQAICGYGVSIFTFPRLDARQVGLKVRIVAMTFAVNYPR